MHLRVVGVGRPVPRLVEAEPADAVELPRVRGDSRRPGDPQDEPQVDVEVTVRAPGRGDREEQRLVVVELGRYPELLAALTGDRQPRVLPVLDVAAGRQPQPRLAVVAEQQAPLSRVDRDEVDDEVLGRVVGSDRTERSSAGSICSRRVGP